MRSVPTRSRLYAGLSGSERTARRREQLLEAGLEVFAARGWAAATVHDVCRGAGLSPRYFYEHFDSREALFRAVLARIAEQVEETVTTALAGPRDEPRERVRAVLQSLVDGFAADPRTVRVGLMESLATEQFRADRRRLLAHFSAEAARLVRSLRPASAGPADADALEVAAALVTGGLVEALVAWSGEAGGPPPEALVEQLTGLYVAAAAL